jgi:NAD(P)-dependent dehydrogenase (short-subunit alcohol dehydrogenase family)
LERYPVFEKYFRILSIRALAALAFAAAGDVRHLFSEALRVFGKMTVFLASDDAAWVTGERLTVSGGYK